MKIKKKIIELFFAKELDEERHVARENVRVHYVNSCKWNDELKQRIEFLQQENNSLKKALSLGELIKLADVDLSSYMKNYLVEGLKDCARLLEQRDARSYDFVSSIMWTPKNCCCSCKRGENKNEK